MKHLIYFLCALLLCACASDNTPDYKNGVIQVYFDKEYPHLNTKLSDLADISFIALKDSDKLKFHSALYHLGNTIYLDSSHLIICDHMPIVNGNISALTQIGVYDAAGNLKAKLVDSVLLTVSKINVDPLTQTIYTQSYRNKNLGKYNFNCEEIGKATLKTAHVFSALLNGMLVCYDHISQRIDYRGELIDRGKSISIYNPVTDEFIENEDLNIPPKDDRVPLTDAITSGMSYGSNGVYLICGARDPKTTYHIDEDFKITEKFYNTGDYRDAENIVWPLVETAEYILFCNIPDGKSRKEGRFPYSTYLFNKQERKIYKIESTPAMPQNYEDFLLQERPMLSHFFNTLNPNVLICPISAEYIKENYTSLPDTLKSITSPQQTDAPVLMVMRFNKKLTEQK